MKYFNITGMAKKVILCRRNKKCPYRCGNTGRGEQPRNNERVKHIITGLLPFLQDERRYKAMNREELIKKLDTVIHNLNEDGLSFMYNLIGDMNEIEKYNINTTPDRVIQIKLLEAEEAEHERASRKEKQHAENMKMMAEEIMNRNEAIASLTGKDKTFWEKIEKIGKMDIGRYHMNCSQIMLIARLFDNNYIDASYSTFCYGFHQGMRYMKNQSKKRKSLGGNNYTQ